MDNYELIEKYLKGELSSNEMGEVEKKLQTDEGFNKEMKLFKDLNGFIGKESDDWEMALTVDEIMQRRKAQIRKESKISILYSGWMNAAVIVAFIGIAGVLYYVFGNNNPQRIYKQFYQTYDIPDTYRSDDITDSSKLLSSAFLMYANKEFDKAIPVFEQIKANKENSEITDIFQALSYMETNEHKKAIPLLMQLANDESMFPEVANWYLGLCYLKTENLEKALPIFEMLSEKDNYYSPKAKRILEKLK